MERNHVCLETAQKLKAAGFPQKTAQTWFNEPRSEGSQHDGSYNEWTEWALWDSYVLDKTGFEEVEDIAFFAAPNAEEIATMLPAEDSDGGLTIEKCLDGSWRADYYVYDMSRYGMHNYPTLAEALAALWLRRQEVEQLREARELNGEPKL